MSSIEVVTSWRQVFPSTQPQARDLAASDFDEARNVTVLFGGRVDLQSLLGDTWEWNGVDWAERAPENSPSGRSAHAMVYDSNRGRMVLFGGYDGGWPSTTWEWDGSEWEEFNPTPTPSGRTAPDMAFDSDRGIVVLFGGFGAFPIGDTWEWNGTSWTSKEPASSPAARHYHKMIYDEVRQRVVLFGGSDGSTSLNDTWEWDGVSWTQMAPVHSPPPRTAHTLIYDSARGVAVLFGGRDVSGGYLDDTWEWNGSDWIQQQTGPGPSSRMMHTMAYDSGNETTVLFGGSISGEKFHDTWLYENILQPVKADFEADPTSGFAPLDVSFSNLSVGEYDTCNWVFGDGGFSSDCNDPSHTYEMTGTYSVTLFIDGSSGTDAVTRAGYILVSEQPVKADFEGDPTSGSAPLDVSFLNLSAGEYDTCLWVFGDGGFSSDCNDPSNTYEMMGTYSVTLFIDGAGGTDAVTRADYILVIEHLTYLPIVLALPHN